MDRWKQGTANRTIWFAVSTYSHFVPPTRCGYDDCPSFLRAAWRGHRPRHRQRYDKVHAGSALDSTNNVAAPVVLGEVASPEYYGLIQGTETIRGRIR